jgi:hypothetical protein
MRQIFSPLETAKGVTRAGHNSMGTKTAHLNINGAARSEKREPIY